MKEAFPQQNQLIYIYSLDGHSLIVQKKCKNELIGVSYECSAECSELYFNERMITNAHFFSKYIKILLNVWKTQAHPIIAHMRPWS